MMSSETQREMLKLLSVLQASSRQTSCVKRFGLVNDRERTLKEIGDEYRLSREAGAPSCKSRPWARCATAMAKREML